MDYIERMQNWREQEKDPPKMGQKIYVLAKQNPKRGTDARRRFDCPNPDTFAVSKKGQSNGGTAHA